MGYPSQNVSKHVFMKSEQSNQRLNKSSVDYRSLNHLTNFTFPPRQPQPRPSPSNTKAKKAVYSEPFNKEKYINANFRFVLSEKEDYTGLLHEPDAIVEWSHVVQVIMCASKPVSCPICLCTPVAPKMTKCGHVYCWPCILHYLHLGEKNWRKCPICYDSIYAKELKSVRFTSICDIGTPDASSPYRLEMTLMRKTVNCAVALPCVGKEGMEWKATSGLPSVTYPSAVQFSKIMLSTPKYQQEIYNKEREELRQSLLNTPNVAEEYSSSPEIKYVPGYLPAPQAYAFISERHFIETALKQLKESLNTSAVDSLKKYPKRLDTSRLSPTQEYFFYQASDGQHLYLHPLEIKMLKHTYHSYADFPRILSFSVNHVQESTMNEELKKRYKYLDHLPMSCDIGFCQVDLSNLVSAETLSHFSKELIARDQLHVKKIEKEEKDYKRHFSAALECQVRHDAVSKQSWEEDTFTSAFPLMNLDEAEETQPLSSANCKWNAGSSFANIAAAKATAPIKILPKNKYENEEDWIVEEHMGWTLDLEESVFVGGEVQTPMGKKKGKKNQTLVISNSGGRRRY